MKLGNGLDDKNLHSLTTVSRLTLLNDDAYKKVLAEALTNPLNSEVLERLRSGAELMDPKKTLFIVDLRLVAELSYTPGVRAEKSFNKHMADLFVMVAHNEEIDYRPTLVNVFDVCLDGNHGSFDHKKMTVYRLNGQVFVKYWRKGDDGVWGSELFDISTIPAELTDPLADALERITEEWN